MDSILLQIEVLLLYRVEACNLVARRPKESSFLWTENDSVVRAALVEDDDREVFQEPAKKSKTSIKPYVEVPKPSDMNFV